MFKQIAALLRRKPVEPILAEFPVKKKITSKKAAILKPVAKKAIVKKTVAKKVVKKK